MSGLHTLALLRQMAVGNQRNAANRSQSSAIVVDGSLLRCIDKFCQAAWGDFQRNPKEQNHCQPIPRLKILVRMTKPRIFRLVLAKNGFCRKRV